MQQEVCVLLDGFIETQVVVTLFSSSDSAINMTGMYELVHYFLHNYFLSQLYTDFVNIHKNITFTSNDHYCEDVIVLDDSVVETTEIFLISLTSLNASVVLGSFTSTAITVLDDDGTVE